MMDVRWGGPGTAGREMRLKGRYWATTGGDGAGADSEVGKLIRPDIAATEGDGRTTGGKKGTCR